MPPDSAHLLIPAARLPGAQPSWPPHLLQWLGRATPTERIDTEEDGPALPHELAVARHNGLGDAPGLTPWAAFETGTVGTPCAWIKPCHWQVGAQYVALADPETLALEATESEALMRAAAPYFEEDGIALTHALPGAWLATGEVFRGLRTWSLERATGRPITPEMLQASTGHQPALRRLQSEMQMLFYTLAVNDQRVARGQLPVNAFWVTGAGVLEQAHPPRPGLQIDGRLTAAARAGDATAHAQAWLALDTNIATHWLPRLKTGEPLRLTLCGERAAQTFDIRPATLAHRLRGLLRGADTTPLDHL
jgi:hypothetical protein